MISSKTLSVSKKQGTILLHSTPNYSIFIISISILIILISEHSLLSTCQSSTSDSYLSQARKLFDTGMEAHEQAQTYSSLLPNEDPRAARLLRDSINKATGSFFLISSAFVSIYKEKIITLKIKRVITNNCSLLL